MRFNWFEDEIDEEYERLMELLRKETDGDEA